MGESTRRRTRTAVVSFLLTLLVTAIQAEHHPDQRTDGGGSNGVVTPLTAVPEFLAELVRLLGELTKS